MNALDQILATLKIEANVFHNGQYCGMWAVDTSGTQRMNFHVVSRGQCFLSAEGKTVELNTGDAVFFPSDIEHRIGNLASAEAPVNKADSQPMTNFIGDDATGLVCGHFGHRHPIFDRLLKQLPAVIVIRADHGLASTGVINLMLRESLESAQDTNLLLNRLSDCLFYLLLRDHLETEQGLFAALAHPKLSKALDKIHAETDQPLRLEALAEVAGMSRSAFSTLFKQVVGQSPIEYITQWRMTKAYRWLADEGISTYNAALRSGYESEASFSKAFKRVMNMGPGQARSEFKVA